MTAFTEVRERILAQAITAQVHSGTQDRLTYSPGGPIDSIIEHALAAQRTPSPAVRREHHRQIVLLAQQVLASNGTERSCVREIAGAAEQIGRRAWTIRELGEQLSPILADLNNPMVYGVVAKRRERLRQLAEILADAPEQSLRCASLRNRLREAKWCLLQRMLDDTVLERLA